MQSGCHIEYCEVETILFCFGCRNWFCERHYSEHQEAPGQMRAQCLFPAGGETSPRAEPVCSTLIVVFREFYYDRTLNYVVRIPVRAKVSWNSVDLRHN